nr:uncharacterized protein LOC115859757 [Globicephala melas]
MTSVGRRGPGLRQEGRTGAGGGGGGGQPGILAAGCSAALDHTRAPHTATSRRRQGNGVGGRKGGKPGRGILGRVGWRGEPPVRPDWLLCSGLPCGQASKKVSVRFNWKQSRLSGPEESTRGSIRAACGVGVSLNCCAGSKTLIQVEGKLSTSRYIPDWLEPEDGETEAQRSKVIFPEPHSQWVVGPGSKPRSF